MTAVKKLTIEERIAQFAKRRTAFHRGATEKTEPTRYLIPKALKCYACSMPFKYRCEFPGCAAPLCAKHTIRKAGGKLCHDHRGAQLVQHSSVPNVMHSPDSVPAAKFVKSNSFVTVPYV